MSPKWVSPAMQPSDTTSILQAQPSDTNIPTAWLCGREQHEDASRACSPAGMAVRVSRADGDLQPPHPNPPPGGYGRCKPHRGLSGTQLQALRCWGCLLGRWSLQGLGAGDAAPVVSHALGNFSQLKAGEVKLQMKVKYLQMQISGVICRTGRPCAPTPVLHGNVCKLAALPRSGPATATRPSWPCFPVLPLRDTGSLSPVCASRSG